MKNSASYLIVLLVISIFASCDTSELKCVRASDNIIKENRDLTDFKGVVFNNWGEVYLTQGPEYSFTIQGPDNVVELSTAEIQNEMLIIGADVCFNGSYDLQVEITAPDYNYIGLIGGGKILSASTITTENISVEVFGIGDVALDVIADTLNTSITGQAKLTYKGNVNKHYLINSGDFVLNGYLLETEHTIINNNGTGTSYITASETLTVNIEGSGDVYYKGTPEIQSSIIGTGEIIETN